MTAVRPTGYPTWCATGATNLAQPDGTHQGSGWGVDEIPPSSYFNFLGQQYDRWIRYFDDSLIGTLAPAPPSTTSDYAQLTTRGPSGASGTARWSLDHLGAPIGVGVNIVREDWTTLVPAAGASLFSGTIPSAPRWNLAGTGLSSQLSASEPQAQYPCSSANLSLGPTAGARMTLSTIQKLVPTGASGVISSVVADVFPFLGTVPASSAVAFGVGGLPASGDAFTGVSGWNATGYARWWRPAGASSWRCETATGFTAVTSVDTGIPPHQLSDGAQSLRIEVCSADSPYGACTRFLYDNGGGPTLVATGIQIGRGNVFAAVRKDLAGFGDGVNIGPVDVAANKRK